MGAFSGRLCGRLWQVPLAGAIACACAGAFSGRSSGRLCGRNCRRLARRIAGEGHRRRVCGSPLSGAAWRKKCDLIRAAFLQGPAAADGMTKSKHTKTSSPSLSSTITVVGNLPCSCFDRPRKREVRWRGRPPLGKSNATLARGASPRAPQFRAEMRSHETKFTSELRKAERRGRQH